MSGRGLTRLAPLATSLALPLILAVGLTACGADDAEPPKDAQTSGASAGTPTEGDSAAVTLTREGDTFAPNGERVELGVDQTLVLTLTADEAGELHVHSTPEQEIVYEAGTSEHEITIDRPGVVEVESHEPDVVVLQLEVR